MSRKKQTPPPLKMVTLPDGMSVQDVYKQIEAIKEAIISHKTDVHLQHPEVKIEDIPAPSDQMEKMITLGTDLSISIDIRRLLMGLLAGVIEISYGEANMQKFALAVKFKVKTIYQYAQVVGVFGFSTCVDYLNAGLRYSHLRAAMYYGDEIFHKLQILDNALDYHWSVERLEAEVYGKESGGSGDEGSTGQKSKTLCNLEGAKVVGYNYRDGTVTLNVGDALSELMPYVGRPVHLKVAVDKLQQITKTQMPAASPTPPDEDEPDEQDDDLSISPDEDEDDDLDYVPRRGSAVPAEEDEIEFA